MELIPGITFIPILHGRIAFSSIIRELCNKHHYDCIAVDLPEPFQYVLTEAITELPIISAITMSKDFDLDSPVYFIPTDPCDATIEAIRQSQQKRILCKFIGHPQVHSPTPIPPLPDEYAITKMGFEEFSTLSIHTLANNNNNDAQLNMNAQYIANQIHQLRLTYSNILVPLHFRHFLKTINYLKQEQTYNLSSPENNQCSISKYNINPDHLYFALGELPFITSLFEKERHDIFASPISIIDTIKDLFCNTRDNYYDNSEDIIKLSPVRIQNGLTFLRNLTVQDSRFIPTLFDIVAAAKGIGGNSFAVRILKSAKYYPYLPIENTSPSLSVGINKLIRSDINTPEDGINLFRDTQMEWKTLSIKPDPSEYRKKKYRYTWNPHGMCSHVPEDTRIENFNTHIRSKATKILCEDHIKTERFQTSVRDGIDIRETLRNMHTGDIYVKEYPPSRGSVDTVVIIFDENHDEKYPQHTTWYAEHDEESTLTFYSTGPFEDLIGPGVARCKYGGLSLLFPPRQIPCAFELTRNSSIKKLSHRLMYGAFLFSNENSIAYIATKKPDIQLKKMASRMKKNIIWIPISSFSSETIRKIQKFHVLNGKTVRSWANRFIGE